MSLVERGHGQYHVQGARLAVNIELVQEIK